MKIANSNQSSSYKHGNSILINFYLVLLKSIYDIMVGSCRFSNYNFFLYSDFFLMKIMFLLEHRLAQKWYNYRKYHKIPIISPGAYFWSKDLFAKLFLGGEGVL